MKSDEIELKVKLEDIVLLAESITKLAQEVYNLHRKIVTIKEVMENENTDKRTNN